MKPPVPYFGGKITLGPVIASLLPAHTHYVEPYGGSLAVLLAKQPSAHETVNDIDGALMTFWRVLRDRPGDLERVCALTPHSRSEFEAARDIGAALDELEQARRIFIQLTQARSGRLTRTGWRHYVDAPGGFGLPAYLAGYVARIGPAASRLAQVSLECRPALDLISKYGSSSEVCLYVDPPYVSTSRTDLAYRHEMNDDDHRALAAALQSASAAVVLSGYSTPLYDVLYDGWGRREMSCYTTQGGSRVPRTEVLWSNRPLADNQPTLWDHAEEMPA